MDNLNDSDNKNLEQAHLDFISTVSHELRTPLTSIRGFADTLLTSFDKLTPGQREKFLLIIKDQSNRLIKLVENLLAVSKMQSDREMLVYKEVNVRPFIESCIQILKGQYKTHTFMTEFDSNLPDIMIDTDKFQQIIINLLDNSAKYSDEGSKVIIRVKQITNGLSIKIIDNGIGICKDNLEKVFSKFSRIDSPLTRKKQGSGLGLYITKKLVEKMQGTISADCSNGETVFEIKFPLAKFGETSFQKIKE